MKPLSPNWSAPKTVRATITTRAGGVSLGVYASLNLGDHVNDDPIHVQQNRKILREKLALPSEPVWLRQVHGVAVVDAGTAPAGATADAAWTDRRGVVLAVLTADCLPILVCDKRGTKIAVIHAGWRGLAAGVVEAGVRALRTPGAELSVHLGPGIGPNAYEVGNDVREAFVARDPLAQDAFRSNGPGRWFADMYRLARIRLQALGVETVSGGEHCTFRERESFYSYRRDGVTGRMASLLWLE
jgi:YfiH family protein